MVLCYRVVRCRPLPGFGREVCLDMPHELCFPGLKGLRPEDVKTITKLAWVREGKRQVLREVAALEVVLTQRTA